MAVVAEATTAAEHQICLSLFVDLSHVLVSHRVTAQAPLTFNAAFRIIMNHGPED